jgi:UDP-N-acetylglucosamine 2-epimerase
MGRAGGHHVQRPLGFHDYNRLQLSAACCLSDSGTIAEESTLLGFPAVTLRDSIERPEALDTGGILMTGLDREDVVAAVGVAMKAGHRRDGVGPLTPDDYLIDNSSERAVNFILSTARRHHARASVGPSETLAHSARDPPIRASTSSRMLSFRSRRRRLFIAYS